MRGYASISGDALSPIVTPYRRSDLSAARRYVSGVLRRRGASKPSKPVRAWTETYTLRVANAMRRAEQEGQRPTLQIGRGHRPPSLYPDTNKPIGLARSGTRSTEHRRAQIIGKWWRQPPYRDPGALRRFTMGHAWRPQQFLILSAYGTLTEGYVLAARKQVKADPQSGRARIREVTKAGAGQKAWRNIWYGTADELPDVLDTLQGRGEFGEDDLDALAEDYPTLLAFEPGSIELWEVRWSAD